MDQVQDNFIFTMDELARSILPPTESSSNATLDNNTQEVTQQITTPTINLSPDSSTAHFGNFSFKRSVKFGDEDSDRNIPLTFISQRVPSVTKRNSIPQTLRPLVERRLSSFSKNHTRVKFLSISPREELTLNPVSGENDMVDMVVLKNESSKNVVFKVKITSPEKFRVRPSTGNIAPGGTEYIRVYLQNEFRNSVPREKLLLMAVETNEENNDFGSVWKNSNEESRMEHRLKCRLFVDKEGTPSTAERMNSMMIQSKHDPYEEIVSTRFRNNL
ncbi:unnamed protein product [Thelazia callipaeda]|uniref:Major sperm protein n=1 Tax=Thelazia callipaeda TaxID=103827 RepID=A0A0N5CVC4_THECL|nr:unnamed protein product [Thelazia callipaeda]